MKKGRKITALLLAMVAAGAMSAGLVACGDNGDDDSGKQEQTTEAEKLKDGGAVVFTDGSSTIDLTQYVKANGNAYRVASSNPNVATATVSGNILAVTEVGTGSAIITVACGNVRLTFSVVVAEAFYRVTLDGVAVPPEIGEQWAAGSSYTLPAAKESDDPNMEFKGWSVNGETKQASEVVTVNKNLTITAVFERKAAVEVIGHAESVSLNEGGTATVAISDFITAYGREVTASAAETNIVTVAVQDGVVTLTGVAQGAATLKLSTEGVTVNIEVNVLSADMPTFANATLDIDLFTQESDSIAFVPHEPSGEHAYAYVYSLRTQDARASITDGTLTYTPGADYDITENGATVSLVVDVAVTIDGNASGTVTFTVTVRIKDTAPAAPRFKNVTKTFDPFSSNGYTLTLKADDEDFTYIYEIDGAIVADNKVYTTEAEETVNVTYTYKGNPSKHGTASFTVKVSFDRSLFPELIEESKSADVDLAEVYGGVYTVDLFANFTNTANISGYTINGTAHTDGTTYAISNTGNTYGETATEVTYTVVATFHNDLGSLTYTYTVNVCDTSAFRMENGGFENGLEGWTGATGSLSSAGTYWEKYPMNNDGQYYDGTVADTETLTSSTFTVGGSGWITFKFGSARPIDGSNLRNIRLEFYEVGNEGDALIAEVRNILFVDPEAALKLNDYKLDLSTFNGKTVYVKAVDGEEGNGDFRFMILDAFVTYWKEAPTDAKYTDLTQTHYFNPTVQIDLNDTNTVTLNPFLSRGLVANPALTATVDKEGLSIDVNNPFLLTAVKSGNYAVAYKLGGDTVFTANVTVTNTAEIPVFENMTLSVRKGESGTLNLPESEAGSRFAYSYAVTANGASVEGNVLSFTSAGLDEGTYPVEISVIVTDTKWGENGDTFNKTFTVTVTVFGEKIIESELLNGGQAELSLDAYEIKQITPEATSAQIDFSKYLIIPESVNAVYTVTRKIDNGEAASVAAENGAYALPFEDCNLTPNAIRRVVFEVIATNDSDAANSVSFTLIVSIKDTTGNRVVNGGFETGDLTGWTVVEGAGADIINGISYWEGDDNMKDQNGVTVNSFMKDGTYFLHTNENGTLILKSSEFVLGGDGYISFKLGGAKRSVSYVALCDAETDAELITVTNNEYFNDPCLPMAMVRRFMDASRYVNQRVYIKIVDGDTEGFGMLTFDALQVSLTQEEAQAIIDSDKAWAATYRQDVLDNASSITGAHTVNIINYIRNYYNQLTLPSAPTEVCYNVVVYAH